MKTLELEIAHVSFGSVLTPIWTRMTMERIYVRPVIVLHGICVLNLKFKLISN